MNSVKTREQSTSGSLLHMREVEEGAAPSKHKKNLAREVEDRGSVSKREKIPLSTVELTSSSLLHTREVGEGAAPSKRENNLTKR